MNKVCLTVVACSYTVSPFALVIELEKLSKKLGFAMKGVVVSNGATDIVDESIGGAENNWFLIKGSNRVHDFSAYAEGLEYLQNSEKCGDAVIFLNDSLFETHHAGQNMRALCRQLETLRKIRIPAISGKCDKYFTICYKNPWSDIGIYVSTYCFALNQAALPILNALDEYAIRDLGSAARSVLDDSWGVGLSLNFRELLRCFLEYGSPDFIWKGVSQYKPNEDLIMAKARCIYSEHRLSGEIGRVGCILPTNSRRIDRFRLELYERAARLMRRLGAK